MQSIKSNYQFCGVFAMKCLWYETKKQTNGFRSQCAATHECECISKSYTTTTYLDTFIRQLDCSLFTLDIDGEEMAGGRAVAFGNIKMIE